MLDVREEKFMSNLTSFEESMLLNRLLMVTVFDVPEFPQNRTGLPTSMFHFSMNVFLTVSIVGTRMELKDNPGGVTKSVI
jgi:hypothetical protein